MWYVTLAWLSLTKDRQVSNNKQIVILGGYFQEVWWKGRKITNRFRIVICGGFRDTIRALSSRNQKSTSTVLKKASANKGYYTRKSNHNGHIHKISRDGEEERQKRIRCADSLQPSWAQGLFLAQYETLSPCHCNARSQKRYPCKYRANKTEHQTE